MTQDLLLADALHDRRLLEDNLTYQIRAFEKKTGLSVTGISYSTIDLTTYGSTVRCIEKSVMVEVKL